MSSATVWNVMYILLRKVYKNRKKYCTWHKSHKICPLNYHSKIANDQMISNDLQWSPVISNDKPFHSIIHFWSDYLQWSGMISKGFKWSPISSFIFNFSIDLQWSPTISNDIQWFSMISNHFQWSPIIYNDFNWFPMISYGIQWSPKITYPI